MTGEDCFFIPEGCGLETRPEDNLLAGIGWAWGEIQPGMQEPGRKKDAPCPELAIFTGSKQWTLIPGDSAPPETALLAMAGQVRHLQMRPIDAVWLAARAEIEINGPMTIRMIINPPPDHPAGGLDLSGSARPLIAPLAASPAGMANELIRISPNIHLKRPTFGPTTYPLSLAARCLIWERLGGPCQGGSPAGRLTPQLETDSLMLACSGISISDRRPNLDFASLAKKILLMTRRKSARKPSEAQLNELLLSMLAEGEKGWTSRRWGAWTIGLHAYKSDFVFATMIQRWCNRDGDWPSGSSCWRMIA